MKNKVTDIRETNLRRRVKGRVWNRKRVGVSEEGEGEDGLGSISNY
jgi:hypothetical protein